MVTIIIAYAAGVPEILDVCLASIERHKAGVPYCLKIITDARGYIEATGEADKYPLLLPEVYLFRRDNSRTRLWNFPCN